MKSYRDALASGSIEFQTSFGVAEDPVLAPALAPLPPSFACADCGESFRTSAGLLSHRARKHGHRRWAASIVGGSRCPSCHKDYGTRLRCLDHLQKRAVRCRTWALAHFQELQLPPAEVQRLAILDREAHQVARRAGRQGLAA